PGYAHLFGCTAEGGRPGRRPGGNRGQHDHDRRAAGLRLRRGRVRQPPIGAEGRRTLMVTDPITLATIWHSLQTTCREARHVIKRTAQSYLIGQAQDVSVGIWDARGNTVAVP